MNPSNNVPDWQNAPVLVSGATNQIGHFLLPRLETAGYQVTALSRRPSATAGRIHWQSLDLATPAHTWPESEARVLFHLAALPFLPSLLQSPLGARLERVLAFSSSSVAVKQDSAEPYERDLMRDLLAAEEAALRLCAQRGIACSLFRPTLIYGCGRDRNVHFISRFIRRFGFFPLAGAGRGLRQPVHADDLAAACLQALACPASFGQRYYLSGGETLRYRQMVERIFSGLGRRARFLSLPVGGLQWLIRGFNWLPGLRHVSPAMVTRMNQDLCFPHRRATADFAYRPRGFHPGAAEL